MKNYVLILPIFFCVEFELKKLTLNKYIESRKITVESTNY